MRKIRDIETVRERLREISPLEEVVQDYGLEPVSAGSDHVKVVCPFHEDTDPSMGISLSKQLFYCHGCGEGGDVFNFIQKLNSASHVEAIRSLAKRAGFDLTPFEAELSDEEKREQRLYSTNEKAAEAAEEARKSPEFQEWRVDRRLSADVVEEYRVGYASEPLVGGKKASSLGLTRRAAWSDAIVVPMVDDYGRVAGFRNRPLSGKAKVIGPSEGHPLDLPPVYGFHQARSRARETGRVILVEGEVDVWQMWAHDHKETCAIQGSSLTDEHLDFLNERGVREVILMPDGDQAGRKLAMKTARTNYRSPVRLKIAEIGDGDPDDLLLRDPEIIETAIREAKYAVHYLVDRVLAIEPTETITDKIDVLMQLREMMADTSEAERDLAVSLLAERLEMDRVSIDDLFREEAAKESKLRDVYAERVVISRMLVDEDFLGDAVIALQPSDFYLDRHKSIFRKASQMYRAGNEIGPDVMKTLLRNDGNTVAANYIDAVLGASDGVAGADFFLGELRDKSVRRQMQEVAAKVKKSASDLSTDSRALIQGHMASVAEILIGDDHLHTMDRMVDARISQMHERMKNPATIIGLDLGEEWQKLNDAIHGLQKKRYMVLAAPSSVGKTAIASGWLARFGIELGVPSLMMTFETGRDAITDRVISNISRVPINSMVTGFLDEEQAEIVHDAAREVAASPIGITEKGRVFEEAQAIIRHDILKRGTRVVFVDYIQLMRLQDSKRKSRYNELGEISGGLLELAHELEISIVALAQINRQGAKNARSSMLDIGDSFIIAQDADLFLVIDDKSKDEVEAQGGEKYGSKFGFLDKNRHGQDSQGFHLQADMSIQRVWQVPGPDTDPENSGEVG